MVRTAWRDRRLTDGGRDPNSRAFRAPASTGSLAGQHLGGSDAAERCGDVSWRRYADGGDGALTAADEGGGRTAPVVLHHEEILRVAPQQEEGVKVALTA
jgi:hypothetical protein